jgi:hypothetical protein
MTAAPSAAALVPSVPQATAPAARTYRRGRAAGVVLLAAAALAAAGTLAGGTPGHAGAAVLTNCMAVPHACGYPDATNSGVPAGTALKAVPAQVTSGPGWSWNAQYGVVVVTGYAANLTGLKISGGLNIEANNVTVNDVQVVTGGPFGISLWSTKGVTIENSTVSGSNSAAGRVDSAICDVYGDSTMTTVKDDNITDFRIAIQMPTGMVEGNYIHDPGYIAGDHTDGIMATGSTEWMTIKDNTVLNAFGQTDAVTLDASGPGTPVANKTVVGNLIGGGGYSLYAGSANNDSTSNIVIRNNRFSQAYFPKSGQFGPVAYYTPGSGNVWSGNVMDTTGQAVAS